MRNNFLDKQTLTIFKIIAYSFLLLLSIVFFILDMENSSKSSKEAQEVVTTKKVSDRDINAKAYQYILSKEYAKASDAFYEVLERHRDDYDADNQQLAYAYINLAWSLGKLEKNDAAMKILERFFNRFQESKVPYIQKSMHRANLIKRELLKQINQTE